MRRGVSKVRAVGAFGTKLKALIEAKSSVTELARVTNSGVTTVYSWITGRSLPMPERMEKLEQFFGVTADELLSGSGRQHAFTLDELAVLAVTVYSGSPWASYGKLKSYIDTHGGELPQLETEAKEVTRNGRQYRR